MTEKEAIKLAKKLEPKIKGHGVIGEYIGNGWNIFGRLSKIRNRLLHI